MTGLSTYLRGLWVTYSVRMWLGWQTQCDVPCLCVSACINIRTRAAFASCFYGSDDTHSHISDCQKASVCIRANSFLLKTQYSHNALWASLITHAGSATSSGVCGEGVIWAVRSWRIRPSLLSPDAMLEGVLSDSYIFPQASLTPSEVTESALWGFTGPSLLKEAWQLRLS